MTFVEHFLDEALGSGQPHPEITITEMGEYLCVQSSEHPVHVYRVTDQAESVHPAITCMEHNGRVYKLAWIEDEKW